MGNEKLIEEHEIQIQKSQEIGTTIYVAIDGTFAGSILIADKIKDDAYQSIKQLKKTE